MISRIKTLLPSGLEPLALRVWYWCRPALRIVFLGRRRYCSVCESRSRFFLSHGPPSRRVTNVLCPICLSHKRHRFAWIYLNSRTNLGDGTRKKLLHIAPEVEFTRLFKKVPKLDYVSADLGSPHAMVEADITAMHWPDDSFDMVYCSHVLEHVPDDRQAMREMLRVLKPGGVALIQVPVGPQATLEDPTITDPRERERVFWQSDHVRLYGLDIADRLRAAGFEVDVVFARQLLAPDACERMGIDTNEAMFHARKPPR